MNNNTYIRDLALVGAGYWGKNLARNFQALGALHTLCDRSEKVLADYSEEYAAVHKNSAFDAVLADPLITKIAIAAPAALHYRLAKAALLVGKDVYVEKPLCLDPAEALELVELAQKRGRILMVGHLLQYHPCVLRLQGLVREGALGRVQYITSSRLNLGKIRHEENALWSLAPHDISVILSLVAGQMPMQVNCTGGAYVSPGVVDNSLLTFRFADGVQAHVYVSWLNPFKEQKITVVGSSGMVVFDDTKPWKEKLIIYSNYLKWSDANVPTPNKTESIPLVVPESEPLYEECHHFLNCCRDRTEARTNGREGLRVLQVLTAAQNSLMRDGEAVDPSSIEKTPPISYFSHHTSIIDSNAVVGAGCKIWHFSHVMAGAELGVNCNLGQNVVISPSVKIGANVKIQNNVSVYSGTVIEDDVFLGPSCVLTNVSNPRSQVNRRGLYEKTCIRKGATIGANATIVCGISLGRYCFIAAGAVVTKDVPDYAFMIGVPARKRGWMSRHGHPLKNPQENGIFICPESHLRYQVNSAGELRCIDLSEDMALPEMLSVGNRFYREIKETS